MRKRRSRLTSSTHDEMIPRSSTFSGRLPSAVWLFFHAPLRHLALSRWRCTTIFTLCLPPGRTYKCDPGVCMANNSCANGRSGVACGGCPDEHVLTVGICTRCPDTSPDQLWIWRAIFCVVGGLIVSVAWFILCWAPVFGATAQEIFMKWFGWYDCMPGRFV